MSIKKMHKSPREYDLSVNWLARIEREIPVLASVFGKPSELPILDAGCGPGRQAAALAGKGYRLVGADKSPDMIDYARNLWSRESSQVEWRVAGYAQMVRRCPGPFAGVYCIGNSLSACGSAAGIHKALHSFSSLLAPGGMLFVQVLNYPPMKSLVPCVKGPTHYFIDGVEHVRFRVFDFARNSARVTNVTLRRKDKGWAADSMCGRLCACSPAELKKWCADAGLQVMEMWGSYAGEKFDSGTSVDAIIIARRKKARS